MRADVAGARYRLQLMAIVEAADTIREGCRLVGVHHSTYYEWKKRVEAAVAPEVAFLPQDMRRRVGPDRARLESTVIAAALAYPSLGPRQLRARVVAYDPTVGSASQVWRILKAHGLSTAAARYRVMAIARGIADPAPFPPREWRHPSPPQVLNAHRPGDLIQMDCFQIGRVKEARVGVPKRAGMVWQYTAIDVASSFVWSQLAVTAHNPSAVHTSALAHQVAVTLATHEWEFTALTTDRGNEFVAHQFTDTLHHLGVEHRYVTRPQTNGKVEQVHNTFLQDLWKPLFARYQPRGITHLREALTEHLWYYNHQRPHHGKWNQGKPPATILTPNTRNQP